MNALHNICAIGNIASGKSTLTKFLASALPDSVEIPESFQENPFLPLSISDPTRWSFTNAVQYFYDYARVYRDLTQGHTYRYCFIDAGGATNREIYGHYLSEEGIITADEYALYTRLCELIERAYVYPAPDAYLYVQSSPDACFERMVARGWSYQTRHINPDYLSTLNRYLDAFRTRIEAAGIPLLILDGTTIDWRTDAGKNQALALVRTFLAQHEQP